MMTAIWVDGVLVLLWGLRYKQIVTFKRSFVYVGIFWMSSIVAALCHIFRSPYDLMAWILKYSVTSNNLDSLEHQDFLHSLPSSSTSTRSCFQNTHILIP